MIARRVASGVVTVASGKSMTIHARSAAIAVIAVFLCGPFLACSRAEARPLTVGSIDDDPADEINLFFPFISYLAAGLGDQGITEGKVAVTESVSEMAAMLADGRVDLYADSPVLTMIVSAGSGAKPMLRRWKDGVMEYNSVIVARTDSGIRTLADLVGHSIAFQERFSSSGYILPRIAIERAGLSLVELAAIDRPVPAGKIGYAFSESDENTMLWVLHGQAAAGATSDTDFARLSDDSQKQLAVILETAKLPRQLLSHRPDLEPALVGAIERVLVTMHETDDGRKVLEGFDRTARFDAIPDEILLELERMKAELGAFPVEP